MNQESAEIVAREIRPLLVAIGEAARLPKGILGVAFVGDVGGDCPVFAAFVGPESTVHAAHEQMIDESQRRNVHYLLRRYHPLIGTLTTPGGLNVVELSKRAAESTSDREETADDIWRPLVHLFGGASDAVPEGISIARLWLREPASLLYFIPANGLAADLHTQLSAVATVAGYSVRLGILVGIMVRQGVSLDEARALVGMLPDWLEGYDEGFLGVGAAAAQWRDRAASIRFSFDAGSSSLRLSGALTNETKSTLIVELRRPDRYGSFVDKHWIAPRPARPARYQLTAVFLALRAAMSKRGDVNPLVPSDELFELLGQPGRGPLSETAIFSAAEMDLPETPGSGRHLDRLSFLPGGGMHVDMSYQKVIDRRRRDNIRQIVGRTEKFLRRRLDLSEDIGIFQNELNGFRLLEVHPVTVTTRAQEAIRVNSWMKGLAKAVMHGTWEDTAGLLYGSNIVV